MEGNPARLSKLVNSAINEGWIPQGGICVVSSSAYSLTGQDFYQALIREESDGQDDAR